MWNKRGMEYAWIFSIIIGAVILFLALFTAQKYTETADFQSQASLVREFDILLNPFSSVGAISTMTLSKSVAMPASVQMQFICNADLNYNEVNLRTEKGAGWSDWLDQGFRIRDKYVFAEPLEGKNFLIFAKPLELPWRIDDLVYITDKSFCFDSPPEHIEREISSLQSKSVYVKETTCPPGAMEVCFGLQSCDINVNYPLGTVKKEAASISFSGDSLMYAAIFSDPALYQCNFNRLIDRINTQIDINFDKAKIMESKGCNTQVLQSNLIEMKKIFSGKLVGSFASISEKVDKSNPKECVVF